MARGNRGINRRKRQALRREYYKLKNGVTEIGKIKREVDEFVRIDTLDRAGRYKQRQNRDRGYER
jgi:hypothetical protein